MCPSAAGARNALRADVAAGARLVLDDNRLVPALLDFLPQDAGENVGAGPRRVRDEIVSARPGCWAKAPDDVRAMAAIAA